MKLPTPEIFFKETERVFGFLLEKGFKIVEKEDFPSFSSILFKGKNIAFGISMDKRDECIDFSIRPIVSKKIGSPRHNLMSYLTQYKNFRGGFKSFLEEAELKSQDPFIVALLTEANALKSLAPEIVADKEIYYP